MTALAAPATAGEVPPPPPPGPHSFIVGGHDSTEPYSWLASMQNKDVQHNCGASLIDKQWLVTAAHCVDGKDAAQWQFRIGSASHKDGGELAQAERFVVNPAYNKQVGNGDIAMVKLQAPVQAAPIGIAVQSPADNTPQRQLGWGQTCPERGCSTGSPEKLQELDGPIVPDSACTAKPDSGYQPDKEICVDNHRGKASSCYGDSGGPSVVREGDKWALVGATSRGQTANCPEFATIYTDVTAYKDWINQQIRGAAPKP